MTTAGIVESSERQTALDFFKRGIPSALPDSNRWKLSVERHRWGWHANVRTEWCPACTESD